ncbi:MAG: hypothetical protein ABI678_12715 [Kofleriaceae bacterium]
MFGLQVPHDTLDHTSRHEREIRSCSSSTEVDVARLSGVLGMARRDHDRASSNGELVAAGTVTERYGDGGARPRTRVESSRVDARPSDHAAGRVRHDARQWLSTRREDQPYSIIATRDGGKRSCRRLVSFRRGCDRPLPGREIERSAAITRGLADDDFAVLGSTTHHCVSDGARAVGDGNDDVRRRIARPGGGASGAGSWLARGGDGRIAWLLAMLVDLGAEEEQPDDDDDECDGFFHENDSQRCASDGCGALLDGEGCEDGDDGLARLALFRM